MATTTMTMAKALNDGLRREMVELGVGGGSH